MKRRIWWLIGVAALIGVLFEGAFAASSPVSTVNKNMEAPKRFYTIQVMSVGKNEISNLDKKAEQLYRSHRLICYIGKSGGKYTLSVGGFESGDRAENIRKRLIKAGLIGEGSFVRYRLSNEVPYLAMSGANSEVNKESQDESRAERSMAPTVLKDQKGVVKGSSKVKYSKAMPKEIEGSREAVNALLEISVKDNKVILKGKAFWKKTLLSYMDDPPRYVLRLFNTENQSVVDTLYNPQKDIYDLIISNLLPNRSVCLIPGHIRETKG